MIPIKVVGILMLEKLGFLMLTSENQMTWNTGWMKPDYFYAVGFLVLKWNGKKKMAVEQF